MNYLARFDESMVTGYLKAAHTTDPDVLHSRHKTLVSSMELGRKLVFIPMGLACLWVLIGIPGLLILVGIIPIVLGSALLYGCIWCRKRLAVNIAVANSAYDNHLDAISAKIPNAVPPASPAFPPVCAGLATRA